jgi:hypothetical protein
LKLLACVGEVKILGKKGEVLIAGVVTSFVVMSPFVGPYLIAEGLYAFPCSPSQGFQLFA